MSEIKLLKKLLYSGYIRLVTGLHIGGSNTALNIGGPDNYVVRNPLTNIPYIPGSSLKGKMRSLVEIKNGETDGGEPSKDMKSKSGALFGVSADSNYSHPSRLIVRDAELCVDAEDIDFSKLELPYAEAKTEVSINRITSKANPRTFERIPAGVRFKVNMVLNIFAGDDEQALVKTLKQAIALLEDDYLGGNGSRGYGQVKFEDLDIDNPVVKTYD